MGGRRRGRDREEEGMGVRRAREKFSDFIKHILMPLTHALLCVSDEEWSLSGDRVPTFSIQKERNGT